MVLLKIRLPWFLKTNEVHIYFKNNLGLYIIYIFIYTINWKLFRYAQWAFFSFVMFGFHLNVLFAYGIMAILYKLLTVTKKKGKKEKGKEEER